MTEWRPIESAPKDGTPFLAWVSGLPYAAKYDESGRFIWYWHTDMARGPSYWVHKIDGKRMLEEKEPRQDPRYEVCGHLWVNGFDEVPTHWMPLPKPPLTEAKDEDRTDFVREAIEREIKRRQKGRRK